MPQLPVYYDLKTAQAKSPYHPREILTLAEERKTKVGITVKCQTILPLQDGLNKNCKTKFFKNAFDGAVIYNDFLGISAAQARALLNSGSINTSMFELHDSELGNEAMLLHNDRAMTIEISIKDIRISRTDLELLLYHPVPFGKTKKQVTGERESYS
ncbi:MAG: hypothetical protein ACOYNL_09540 [Rickettsiales bacterium]